MEDMGTAYFVYMLRGPSMLAINSNMAAFQIILQYIKWYMSTASKYITSLIPTEAALKEKVMQVKRGGSVTLKRPLNLKRLWSWFDDPQTSRFGVAKTTSSQMGVARHPHFCPKWVLLGVGQTTPITNMGVVKPPRSGSSQFSIFLKFFFLFYIHFKSF